MVLLNIFRVAIIVMCSVLILSEIISPEGLFGMIIITINALNIGFNLGALYSDWRHPW
jgi:hypothetical protein